MGTWGTAIFSDDTACDVRNDFRELIGDGLSGSEATQRLLAEWSSTLNDPDEASVFWLALAATQWKCGRLEPLVRERALDVINHGSDLERWESGSREYKKRQAVLQKLQEQLPSPQPPKKRIPQLYRDTNEWQVGELVAYGLLSGRFVIFRVIGHHSDKGGTSPVCELLDWVGNDIPDCSYLASLEIRRKKNQNSGTSQLMLCRATARQRPDNRLNVLGMKLKPSQVPRFFTVLNWKWLDKTLSEDYGIE